MRFLNNLLISQIVRRLSHIGNATSRSIAAEEEITAGRGTADTIVGVASTVARGGERA